MGLRIVPEILGMLELVNAIMVWAVNLKETISSNNCLGCLIANKHEVIFTEPGDANTFS